MISGEYLVLSGAAALAMPLRFGQSLQVMTLPHRHPGIEWEARENGETWFSARLEFNQQPPETVFSDNTGPVAQTLCRILNKALQMNSRFIDTGRFYQVITNANFSLEWGLGSSSTLISNLAWWANTDPYQLLFQTLGGSGYDIACARSNSPISYRYNGPDKQPTVRPVPFNPPFASHLHYVYSGKKQSTAGSIASFNASKVDAEQVHGISEITGKMAETKSLKEFRELILEHESITGRILKKTPVQQLHFNDFDGVVKSLGAWGGDFLLAASDMPPETVREYFQGKGYHIIIPHNEMILPEKNSKR